MAGVGLLALKSTLVIAAAFLIAVVARRGRASMRHGVFAALFITLLLLPVVPRFVKPTTVEVPAALAQKVPVAAEESVPVAESVAPAATPRANFNFVAATGNVYVAGVVLMLASLAAGVWRLRQWADHAEVWGEGMRVAVEVAGENGIRRAVLVVVSDDVSVPLTFGFRRQTIVMPSSSREWSTDAVRRAIRHELEHVRRDDWTMQLVARVAVAVYWPHPMVWMAFRRFCLEAERACDDAVVNASDPSTYADQLVTLARTLGRGTGVPALAMASPSRLSERVHAILDPRQARGPQSRGALLVTASIMAAVAITFGSVHVVAAASDAIEDGVREGVEGALEEDGTYRDAVVEAAERGDIDALQFFEKRGIDLNDAIIGDGTPLLIAARSGRMEAVRWLVLDRRVDVNEPSPGDGNALIAAASKNRIRIMKFLLDHGAEIENVVPGDENALITAAADGSIAAVDLLIERGANVNARVWADDREWRTPLNQAVENGHDDIVRMLTAAGARE